MNIKHEIKVGAFLLMSIAILIYTVMWLNNFEIGNNLHIVARFKDAGIISKGTKVIYRGVTAGTVDDIDISPDQEYALATLRISNKKLKLVKGSTASIIDKGFTGTKVLSINPPPESMINKEFLKNGDIIEGKKSFTFEELQKLLTKKSDDGTLENIIDNTDLLIENTNDLTDKLDKFLTSIENLTTKNSLERLHKLFSNFIVLSHNLNITSMSLNKILDNNTIAKDLKQTFKTTNMAMNTLNNVADKTNNLIDKSDQTINNLDNVINGTNNTLNGPQGSLRESFVKISSILSDIKGFTGDKELPQNIKSFIGETSTTIGRLNCFTTELSRTVSKRFLIPRFIFGSPGKKMGRCTK